MNAGIISGKTLSDKFTDKIAPISATLFDKNPCLTIIIVGDNPSSVLYVERKIKMCTTLNIKTKLISLPSNTTTTEILNNISKLTLDDTIHGILIQLPLPRHVDTTTILEHIPKNKDVDCLNTTNLGKIFIRKQIFMPCTACAAIQLLKYGTNEPLVGKRALVIGHSYLTGIPISELLTQEQCTVTMAHKGTKNLPQEIANAEIIVTATGNPGLIPISALKNKPIIIDIGITVKNGKVIGDVDYRTVLPHVSGITPVPGGVGPVTISNLMINLLNACIIQNKLNYKVCCNVSYQSCEVTLDKFDK